MAATDVPPRLNGHLQEIPMLKGWRFHLGDAPGAEAKTFADKDWQPVSIPHDWSIAGPVAEKNPSGCPGGFFPNGLGWYRTTLRLSPGMRGKAVWIEFDGVMLKSEVFCNGRFLGFRPSGHSTFRYDLTPVLVDGDNLIAVKVDNSVEPAHRWYTGSGINRQVRLVVFNPVHLAFDGLQVLTPVATAERAEVTVQARVVNDRATAQPATVTAVIRAPNGTELSRTTTPATLAPGENRLPVIALPPIFRPSRWSPEEPALYTLVTEVTTPAGLQDRKVLRFGVREFGFEAATGFWINGHNTKLRGVCLHQDGGGVGTAVPLSIWERRLLQLKSIGCNAIRTSHTGVAPEFLDLCDQLGFLVMSEYFDSWEKVKTKGDFSRFFKEWWKSDLIEYVLRDRNHPSIVIWSAGNEMREFTTQDNQAGSKRIYSELAAVFHELDPSRSVTVGCNLPYKYQVLESGFAKLMDVAGFNYAEGYAEQCREADPSIKILAAETRKGSASWKMIQSPAHAGQFIWTGFDYLGECPGWPFISRDFGLFDRCGVPYPVATEQALCWSPRPRVALFRVQKEPDGKTRRVADWNLPAGETTTGIYLMTHCPEVELRLNGKSLGVKQVSAASRDLNTSVPATPGTLEVVGLRDGKPVCSDRLVTAHPARRLTLSPDRPTATISWDDVVFCPITVADDAGTRVPAATLPVTLTITGPGRLVSLDNGDLQSHEGFAGPTLSTFDGRCLALIRATGLGTITVTATAPGLAPASVTLQGVTGTWAPVPAVFTAIEDPLPYPAEAPKKNAGSATAPTATAITAAPAQTVTLTQAGQPLLTATLPPGWQGQPGEGRIIIATPEAGMSVDLRVLPTGTSISQATADLERLLAKDLITVRITIEKPLTVAGAPGKHLGLFACAVSDGFNSAGFAGLFTVNGRTCLLLAHSHDDLATWRHEKALLGILSSVAATAQELSK
jgi:beta-galactosidase